MVSSIGTFRLTLCKMQTGEGSTFFLIGWKFRIKYGLKGIAKAQHSKLENVLGLFIWPMVGEEFGG